MTEYIHVQNILDNGINVANTVDTNRLAAGAILRLYTEQTPTRIPAVLDVFKILHRSPIATLFRFPDAMPLFVTVLHSAWWQKATTSSSFLYDLTSSRLTTVCVYFSHLSTLILIVFQLIEYILKAIQSQNAALGDDFDISIVPGSRMEKDLTQFLRFGSLSTFRQIQIALSSSNYVQIPLDQEQVDNLHNFLKNVCSLIQASLHTKFY